MNYLGQSRSRHENTGSREANKGVIKADSRQVTGEGKEGDYQAFPFKLDGLNVLNQPPPPCLTFPNLVDDRKLLLDENTDKLQRNTNLAKRKEEATISAREEIKAQTVREMQLQSEVKYSDFGLKQIQ